MVRCESRSSTIGHITLGTKQTGAPSAGNPHAGCDAAGAGNGFTVWLLRHSQRKRGETARLDLRNTASVLDPTGLATGKSRINLAPMVAVAIRVYRDKPMKCSPTIVDERIGLMARTDNQRHLSDTAVLLPFGIPEPRPTCGFRVGCGKINLQTFLYTSNLSLRWLGFWPSLIPFAIALIGAGSKIVF